MYMKNKKMLVIVGTIALIVGVAVAFGIARVDPNEPTENLPSNNSTGNPSEPILIDADSNDPMLRNNEKAAIAEEDVYKLTRGSKYALVSGEVQPAQYSNMSVFDKYYDGDQKTKWAFFTDVVDAQDAESLELETNCSLNGSSTGCPYLYFQSSSDMETWHLLTMSNTSPPIVGNATYTYDLTDFQPRDYYRFALVSKECEGGACRTGEDWYGRYRYNLNVTFR